MRVNEERFSFRCNDNTNSELLDEYILPDGSNNTEYVYVHRWTNKTDVVMISGENSVSVNTITTITTRAQLVCCRLSATHKTKTAKMTLEQFEVKYTNTRLLTRSELRRYCYSCDTE